MQKFTFITLLSVSLLYSGCSNDEMESINQTIDESRIKPPASALEPCISSNCPGLSVTGISTVNCNSWKVTWKEKPAGEFGCIATH